MYNLTGGDIVKGSQGKESAIDKLYKFLGILIPVAAAGIGYLVLTMINIREVTTENDFITAMLHSDGVYNAVEKLKTIAALAIFALGICFGIVTFGLGVVLARLRKLGAH